MKEPHSPRRSSRQQVNPPDILSLFKEKKSLIRKRLDEFRRVGPEDYFYEVAFCLLTPQSSARNALAAIDALRQMRFESASVDPEPVLRRKDSYIRFHRTKARRLTALKEMAEPLRVTIATEKDPVVLRDWLVKNIDGLGLKEATHVLRNIGRNGDLAILDRHILRNMKRYGIIHALPKTLTPRRYRQMEGALQRFAKRIGLSVNELDLLFWSEETGEIIK